MSLVTQLLTESPKENALDAVKTHVHIAMGLAQKLGDGQTASELHVILQKLENRPLLRPQAPSSEPAL